MEWKSETETRSELKLFLGNKNLEERTIDAVQRSKHGKIGYGY